MAPAFHASLLALSLSAGLATAAVAQVPGASSTPFVPRTTNLSYASLEPALGDGLVAFRVSEAAHGTGDLNGDLDTGDHVLHVHDGWTGTTTNLGLAVEGWRHPRCVGRVVSFEVSEADQGGTDLNGDGDALDHVQYVYDARTATVQRLGLAGLSLDETDGRRVAFLVDEAAQKGSDLNADGDSVDRVLHLYDARTGSLLNLQLACRDERYFELSGRWLAVLVEEAEQGGGDLNGDGDAFDSVLHVFDWRTRSLTNVGIAPSSTTPTLEVHGSRIAVTVREASQGPSDLNGDGDVFDEVLHVVDAATGVPSNLGLAAVSVHLQGRWLACRVPEYSQGNVDLNSDGDAGDEVVHLRDLRNATTLNLGLAAPYLGLDLDRGWLACLVIESRQGATDLNGDGDTNDWVLHVHDTSGHTTTNLALACAQGVRVGGERVVAQVNESAQGATDLNGDGDTNDAVVHVFDGRLGSLTNLGLAGAGSGQPAVVDGDRIVFRVRESSQGGSDLNGDGDTLDFVTHVLDANLGQTTSFGLACEHTFLVGTWMAFLVRETEQGATDLNGDGDALDEVVHIAR